MKRLWGASWRGGLSVAIVWRCKEERKNKRANIPICSRIVCQSWRSEWCDCLSWSAFFCVSRKTFVQVRKSKQKLKTKTMTEEQGTKNPELEANLMLGFCISCTYPMREHVCPRDPRQACEWSWLRRSSGSAYESDKWNVFVASEVYPWGPWWVCAVCNT